MPKPKMPVTSKPMTDTRPARLPNCTARFDQNLRTGVSEGVQGRGGRPYPDDERKVSVRSRPARTRSPSSPGRYRGAVPVRVVHLVAKTHLDLGFTALASEVEA